MTAELLHSMAKWADRDAIVAEGRTTTYADLLVQVSDWQTALLAAGVTSGSVVALEAPQSAAAAAALLALARIGAIAMPFVGLAEPILSRQLTIAEAEFVVDATVPSSLRKTGSAARHPLYQRLHAEAEAGLVLFSSGTSGTPKATVLSFDRMLRRYAQARKAQCTLGFLNLDHIGGINTMLHTLSQGGTTVTVVDRSPEAVCAAIAAHGVEVLPTTPTFLTMLLISGAHQRHDLSSLRLITYGTEPMPATTLASLREQLPEVRLKQTYGLSELGILSTRSKDDGSLWMQLGGKDFDYEIRDAVLWIKSEMAMLGYLNADAPFDDRGYFNTQDQVEVDGDFLRVLGRTSELINVGGEKVFPSEVESVLLQMSNVAEATVSGRPSPVTGNIVKATLTLVESEDPKLLRRRVQEFCAGRLAPYKIPALVEVSDRQLHSDRFKKVRSLA